MYGGTMPMRMCAPRLGRAAPAAGKSARWSYSRSKEAVVRGGDEIPCLGFKISLRPLVGEAPEVVLLVGVVVRGGGSIRSHHAITRGLTCVFRMACCPGRAGEATVPPPVIALLWAN